MDEADTLLDMGFRSEIDAIAEFLPPTPERQTFMFSATVSSAIRDVAREILNPKHKFINCVSNDAPPVHAHIPQHYTVLSDAAQQLPHVLRLLAHDQLTNVAKSKVIVFLPTTKLTKLFSSYLKELSDSLPAGKRTRIYEIHSLLNQQQRTRTSDYFRKDNSGASILVSSDVSARGVDYPGVTRVIQVGVPTSADQYVHRVGRTGRGSVRTGRADIVLLPFESGFVKWQLHKVPIQFTTAEQLETEVLALAKAHDEDPQGFLAKNAPDVRPSAMRAPFADQIAPALSDLPEKISSLHEQIDPDAVKDTVASMMGYYVGRTGDARCSKEDVLYGLKDWAVQAGGMPTAPHFSHSFLARLGFSEGSERRGSPPQRRGSFGMRSRDSSGPREDRGSSFGSGERQDRRSSYGQDRGSSFGRDRDDSGFNQDRESGYSRPRRDDSRSKPSWMHRGRR